MLLKQNIVMACLISGVYGVNRSCTLENDNYDTIKDWANSLISQKIKGIVFHNNFSDDTIAQHSNTYLQFIKIVYNKNFNTNTYRYILYYNYLIQQKETVKNVFLTDITDVVMVKNPFESDYYKQNKTKIFCGDEPKKLKTNWMLSHGEHFRNTIKDYQEFEKKYENETLLNCGIIGGQLNLMLDFLEKICFIHKNYNKNNPTAFTGDMGAFNYLMRTQFINKFVHGEPCNTVFKAYQTNRNDCWFRHK